MNYYHEMHADRIRRVNEEMDSLDHKCEGWTRDEVRKVALEILQTFGHRNNVYDVRLDNETWVIYYDSTMPFKDRKVLVQLIAEELQHPTEKVKLVGFGY